MNASISELKRSPTQLTSPYGQACLRFASRRHLQEASRLLPASDGSVSSKIASAYYAKKHHVDVREAERRLTHPGSRRRY